MINYKIVAIGELMARRLWRTPDAKVDQRFSNLQPNDMNRWRPPQHNPKNQADYFQSSQFCKQLKLKVRSQSDLSKNEPSQNARSVRSRVLESTNIHPVQKKKCHQFPLQFFTLFTRRSVRVRSKRPVSCESQRQRHLPTKVAGLSTPRQVHSNAHFETSGGTRV